MIYYQLNLISPQELTSYKEDIRRKLLSSVRVQLTCYSPRGAVNDCRWRTKQFYAIVHQQVDMGKSQIAVFRCDDICSEFPPEVHYSPVQSSWKKKKNHSFNINPWYINNNRPIYYHL